MLSARNLGSLLDETFSLYRKHLRYWIALVAIVEVPVNLVSLALTQIWGGAAAAASTALLGAGSSIFVYGAAVFGVGQHYVTGGIVIRDCFARVWWRAWVLMALALMGSLAVLLALVAIGITALVLLPPLYGIHPAVGVLGFLVLLLVVSVPLAIAIAIYWGVAVQAVIVEGYKAIGSLQRSFALVRGSWWRVFEVAVMLSLIALGLAVLITIPIAIFSFLAGTDLASGLATFSLSLGSTIVGILVPPVVFIAWTLLYYDMRVRREEYDIAELSRELGIATT